MTSSVSVTEPERAPEANLKRADALDALRGLAILAMVFSGTIRFKILPAWMYHAQVPPPDHAFNADVRGLTWVDVVFPLFLFVMGVAIPLALSRRLQAGWGWPKLLVAIVKRGFLLGSFAIVSQHLRPYAINKNPTDATWWVALLGFGLLSLMYGQFQGRSAIAQRLKKVELGMNILGWVATIGVISQLQYGGDGFSLERSDVILVVLANMSVFGALIWLLTRHNVQLRLGCLGLLLALQLSAGADGWIQWLWGSSPVPWILRFEYLKYLFIVIPGTIVGDRLLEAMRPQPTRSEVSVVRSEAESLAAPDNSPDNSPESSPNTLPDRPSQNTALRYWLPMILMVALCVVLLVGLQGRWVWQTTLLSLVLAAIAWVTFSSPRNISAPAIDPLLRSLYLWGVYWLCLGLFFEPFQGGIRKDSATYSYYFVTTAIAIFLLIALMIWVDGLKQRKWLSLLIDNGRNPMIAYVAFGNFVWPVLTLTGLEDWVLEHTNTPLLGALKGVFYTLMVALVTSLLTRLRFAWKT